MLLSPNTKPTKKALWPLLWTLLALLCSCGQEGVLMDGDTFAAIQDALRFNVTFVDMRSEQKLDSKGSRRFHIGKTTNGSLMACSKKQKECKDMTKAINACFAEDLCAETEFSGSARDVKNITVVVPDGRPEPSVKCVPCPEDGNVESKQTTASQDTAPQVK